MKGFWGWYARLVVRLRLLVVLAWILCGWWVLQQPHVQLPHGGAGLRDLAPVDLPAVQAELRTATSFAVPLHSRTLSVQHDPAGLSLEAQAAAVRRAVVGGREQRWPDLLGGVPLINQPPIAGSRPPARTTAVTYLVFDPDTSASARTRQARAFADAFPHDVASTMTGAVPARISTADRLLEALPRLEVITAAVIAVVVAAFYRSVVAPLIVMLTVGMSFVVSQWSLGTLARMYDREVPREVEPLLVALLLGIVTDYCLFFLSSMRRRLRVGEPRRAAVTGAIAATSPIVLVAALTVAAGCASLALARTGFLAAFGPALALTVLVAALVALTLVPALMAILGAGAYWPARTRPGRSADRNRRGVVAVLLTNRATALATVVVVLVPLLVASWQVRDMRLGYDVVSGLPASDPVRQGAALATRGFPDGIVAPTVLVVEGDDLDEHLPELARLQDAVEGEPGIAGTLGARAVQDLRRLVGEREAVRKPLDLVVSPDGSTARMLLVLEDPPYGGRAVQRLDDLREQLPALAREAGLPRETQVSSAGDTAVVLQLLDRLRSDMQLVTLAVIVLDLVLLTLFLRSAVAPLLVVAGSVLGVAASLGITTVLFQGPLGSEGITFYVPLATLVLLLSLGADYGVFAVGRAWEISRELPLREALVQGSAETSSVIAIAGLLLGASFALLALVPLDAFLQFAVAMSLGILIDTFVIRPLLLPASILALGEASMWPRRPAPRRS